MKFTKMEGLGNDYVYVNCFKEEITDVEELAKKVSDRHFGIGADGLILIKPSKVADFEMAMYNADGSRGEMCGNGIRCVAKYVYDYGLTDKTSISVETLAGIKYLELTIEDNKVSMVKVDMGAPVLTSSEIPVLSENEKCIEEEIFVIDKTFNMTCVSMGNPHAVVKVDDVENFPIEKYGPEFENNKAFPRRINTEFIKVTDRKNITMRVWERGSAETLACGTGACAVAVACITNGLCDREVTLHLRGGDLLIKWEEADNHVYMTGPARVVFDGEIKV